MASVVTSLLSGGIGPLFDGLSKFVSVLKGKNSPEAQAAAAQLEQIQAQFSTEIKLAEFQQQSELLKANADAASQQADVNKVEAASTRLFVSGWRPFIGWVCGTGLACQFIIGPLFTWLAMLSKHPAVFPALDLGTLLTLLLGMLGLGGMRTFEKTKGVA
jgi:hypothetical protein